MTFGKNLVMALAVAVLVAIAVITDIRDISVSRATTEIFPRHPVEMVIPFGTGGASDIFARQYAQIVSGYLGESLIAINKSGAGTIEGLLYAVNAPADGYTILEITPSLLIVEAQNKSSVKFRTEFEPLLKIQNDIVLFGVADSSPHKTIEQLLAFARENPGNLKIGGLSPGGLDNYIASGFAKAAGIEWTYVAYKSGAELKSAVLGGELDVYQDKLISFMSLVSSGDVRSLVVLNDERIDVPGLQDVPSSVEKGINFTQGSWRGFAIRKNAPPEIRKILIEAFQKAYDDPQYKEMEEREMTTWCPGTWRPMSFANPGTPNLKIFRLSSRNLDWSISNNHKTVSPGVHDSAAERAKPLSSSGVNRSHGPGPGRASSKLPFMINVAAAGAGRATSAATAESCSSLRERITITSSVKTLRYSCRSEQVLVRE